MNVDVTHMDPIVFANTWHEAEKLADTQGMHLNYSKGAVYPFQLLSYGNRLMHDFKSLLDLKSWLEDAADLDLLLSPTHSLKK